MALADRAIHGLGNPGAARPVGVLDSFVHVILVADVWVAGAIQHQTAVGHVIEGFECVHGRDRPGGGYLLQPGPGVGRFRQMPVAGGTIYEDPLIFVSHVQLWGAETAHQPVF